MFRVLVVATAMLLGASSAIADEIQERAVAPTAAIEQLIRSPLQYDRKYVRVRGQVDNCISQVCNFCPESMTRETVDYSKCLGLRFDGYGGEAGADLDTSALVVQAFRFATVTVSAKFDATCPMQGENLEKGSGAPVIVICQGHGIVLKDARVEVVHSRKSVLDGLVTYYDGGYLGAPPSREERTAMQNATADTYSRITQYNAFLFIDESNNPPPKGFEKLGLGCACKERSCDGRWPVRYSGGFDSPGNPFVCWPMVRKNGEWRVLPRD